MKKIFLGILLFIVASSLYAQISRNTLVIGGNFNYSTKEIQEGNISYNFDYSIQYQQILGFFIINNLCLSIDPVYGYSLTKSFSSQVNDDGKTKTIDCGIAPNVSYYFLKGNILPYIQFEMTFLKKKETENYFQIDHIESRDFIIKNRSISPGIGVLYRVNSFIGIDLSIQYSWTKESSNMRDDINISGIYTYIGFKMFLFTKQL